VARCTISGLLSLVLLAVNVSGQIQTPLQQSPGTGSTAQDSASASPREPAGARLRIGRGDEVEIRVYGAPDLSQPNKVNDEGNISMPLLGYVHLEGLTSKEAEELIARRLREGEFLRDPQVTVLVKQYMSDGVTVLGEVNRPGIYPVPNSGRLLDLILAAGGFTPKAGYTAVVKRRERGDSPLTIQLTGDQPMDDIQVMPGDIISIPKGKIVYVLGAVNQPGGYVIPDGSLSVLEAVARANGPSANASLGKTQLLHRREGVITQVPIPLPSVMKGKTPDPKLQADDILYIPPKSEKSAYRTVMSLASLAGTVAIFRPY
jgi:polysaccharide biosynthesis/export protein